MPSSAANIALLFFITLAGAQPCLAATLLQPLNVVLDGAGCIVWIGDKADMAMTVAFGSVETGNASTGVALVRIPAVVHSLECVDQSPKRWVFRGADRAIELNGMTEIRPTCRGGECEGSHYRADLSVRCAEEQTNFDARMHSGS